MVAAVRASLSRLEADPATDARAALALHLAKQLDLDAEVNTGALSRELRLTLAELEASTDGDDADAFSTLIAELSTPLVDAQD